MRAAAIVLVVYGHTAGQLPASGFDEPAFLARDGVGLFFVLSGFLVGGITYRRLEARDGPIWSTVLDLWQRRWLRTLPNYYLFLLINIGLVYTGIRPGILNMNVAGFFVLVQNLIVPVDLFFGESWSLALEEWFYLLLPLLVVMFTWRRSFKWGFLLATVVLLVAPIVSRYHAGATLASPHLFDAFVGMIVVHRLDAIAWGVLAMWLMHHSPPPTLRARQLLFALGIVGLVTLFHAQDWHNVWFSANIYFLVSAICMALLLPLLVYFRRTGRWGHGVAFISRISFALYLVHLPVYYPYFKAVKDHSVAAYLGYWVVCIVLATIVHHTWELPFMRSRDRLSLLLLRTSGAHRPKVDNASRITPGSHPEAEDHDLLSPR